MEKLFTNFVFYLLPHWRLYSTPWMNLWQENQKRSYVSVIRFSLVVFILTYIGHHYFVDVPLGLAAEKKWLYYRFGVAGAGFFCFMLTFYTPFTNHVKYYKSPVVVLGIATGFLQTLSMTWYNQVPYFWGIAIPIIFAAILKMSALNSIIYCALIYALQFNHYLTAGVDFPLAIGACLTGVVFVAIIKRNMATEVANFIEQQSKIEVERKLVESKKEMVEQVQGFLPKVINERIIKNIEENKMSVVQAIDEELRPKQKMISCLYSDIRSFTKLSKNPAFISESVVPDTHEAISIVEEYNGIPRTIGDLVFSYFDEPKIQLNVIRTVLAAYDIFEATQLRNKGKSSDQIIKRFLIMTVGEAIVGNIGGARSAREITALGSCVNKSARLDEYTKFDEVKNIISTKGILMDQNSYFILADYVEPKSFKNIKLDSLTNKIRDFESDEVVWYLEFNASMIHELQSQLDEFIKKYNMRGAS